MFMDLLFSSTTARNIRKTSKKQQQQNFKTLPRHQKNGFNFEQEQRKISRFNRDNFQNLQGTEPD